ncbi:hypothetical protein D3C83_48420 [compost metagenome]
MRQRDRHVGSDHGDPSADEIKNRQDGTLVGNVRHFRARYHLEHLATQVGQRADPAAAVGEPLLARFRQGDQLLDGFRRNSGVDDEKLRRRADQGYRREVAQ